MDSNTLHFDWNWQLSSTPEELWPLVSDTNRLNFKLGLPPVQKADLSYDQKYGHVQMAYDSLRNSDAWEEEPYEWEKPYRISVVRRYKNGAYRDLSVQVDLYPNSRGTNIRYRIGATPRSFLSRLIVPLKLNLYLKYRLKSVLKKFDHQVESGLMPYEDEKKKRLVRGGRQRLAGFRQSLLEATGERKIIDKLAGFIEQADDMDALHIEPYVLADNWKLSRTKVLSVFLHATKLGLLNFNWNLHCPDCQKVQHTCKTLNEIHEPIYCSDCNKEFYVNFSTTVQLSFRVNPLVRKLSEEKYSLNGPQEMPHITVSQFIRAGQKRYIKTDLDEGRYKLRIPGLSGCINVLITEDGSDNVTITLTKFGLNDETVKLSPQPNLTLENQTPDNYIFNLEETGRRSDVVSAAKVTSQQNFRNLFDKEVIRKGEKIAVDEQTLMFTDLIDSTGMYNKQGDDAAVGCVIEHFDVLQQAIAEQDGAIVKTIGDSVMAVFSTPQKAFRAYIKANRILTKENRFNQNLKLKAGIHHGSCVAVNLNNRIDYFGSTVNIASRLVDFADENEVIISESVSEDKEIIKLISNHYSGYEVKDTRAQLRGFNDELFKVKRISLEKPSVLRRVG